MALVLCVIGVYGVIAYAVAQRRREVGIRMALGAPPTAVKGMFLRQGLRLAAAGIALGLIAATALSRLISSLLFGVCGARSGHIWRRRGIPDDGGTGCDLLSSAPGGVRGPDGNAQG